MRIRSIALQILFVLALLTSTAHSDSNRVNVVSFDACDTVSALRMDVPFTADIGFTTAPSIGVEEDLIIRFTPIRDIEDSLWFDLHITPEPFVDIEERRFVWAYADSGVSFQEMIGIECRRGGSYTVSLAQRDRIDRPYVLHEFVLSFGRDGELIWMGKRPSAASSCPGLFATDQMTGYTFSTTDLSTRASDQKTRPFDITIRLDSMPKSDRWCTARFELIANKKFMRDVQYEILHHPITRIRNISESWSTKTERGDRFEGSFEFYRKHPGLSYITLKVFAKDFRTLHTGKAETELTFFMAYDANGNLAYLGDANICECDIDLNDPIYPFFSDVLDYPGSMFRTKSVRSKPDFEKIAKDLAAEMDSTKVDQEKLDSLMNSVRRKK